MFKFQGILARDLSAISRVAGIIVCIKVTANSGALSECDTVEANVM